MIGEYDYDILARSHVFWVTNQEGSKSYKFTVEEFEIKECESVQHAATYVHKTEIGPWIGLAESFQRAGLIPESAVDAELKATKFHLEDMRSLAAVKTSLTV